MSIAFDKFEEQIFFNTVLIKNLTTNETGTAFLLKKENGDRAKFLLFSNKHVFWGKKYKDNLLKEVILEITLHKKEADESYIMGSIHNFRMKITKGNIDYHEHKDEEIDVACVNISEAFNIPDLKLNVRTIGPEHFENLDLSKLYCGEKIIFIGYPAGFYDKTNFLPVVRTGTISSIPSVDFNGKAQILIDAQVFPGSSGSPVFVPYQGKYHLLGIVSESVYKGMDYISIQNTAEETVPTQYPIQFIGLGMVYKYQTIKDIYDIVEVK